MRIIRWSAILGALSGVLFIAGCGTTPTGEDEGYGIEAPGRYMVGDSFTFDNPTLTWQVVAVEGEKVYWRSDKGDEQVTGHDPLLPALEWKNPDRGGGRRGIADMNGSLFPLKAGNLLTFTSNVESWTIKDGVPEKPQQWQYNWSCNVAGQEKMEVPAGTFDTYKIQCGRYKPTELEFFYAPKIGHYVVMRIDDPPSQGTITRNLLSFRRIAMGHEPVALQPAPPPPPPPPAPAPAPPAPVAQPIAPPPPPPPSVQPGSGPRVVLGRFSTEENAARGWGIFSRQSGGLLGGLQPEIRPTGQYFRLATQRLDSTASARDLCRKLKSRGMECFVTSK